MCYLHVRDHGIDELGESGPRQTDQLLEATRQMTNLLMIQTDVLKQDTLVKSGDNNNNNNKLDIYIAPSR